LIIFSQGIAPALIEFKNEQSSSWAMNPERHSVTMVLIKILPEELILK
jgi:hypothetical protein